MEQDVPLKALAEAVAAIRARGLAARLVVRNTERFGLLHLYFEQKRLAHVAGHLGDPLRSLADLSSWQSGSIRQDSTVFTGPTVVFDPRLDTALDNAVGELVARSIVTPAATPVAAAQSPGTPPRSWPPASKPHSIGTGGLPPLGRAATAARAESIGQATGLAQRERLTTPQWQLVALVVRQMVEKMGQIVGDEMAESLLRLSLAHSSRSNPVLHDLEVEPYGWLKETQDVAMTVQAAEDVAEGIAALLTNYELRCASLIGKQQAHDILASTAEPFRAALAQIGLDISG